MNLQHRLISKLVKKFIPRGVDISLEGVSYSFPLGLKFRTITIYRGAHVRIKLTEAKVIIMNPIFIFFSRSTFKISSIKWHIAEVSFESLQKKEANNASDNLPKRNLARLANSFLNRIERNIKSVSFCMLKCGVFSISDFALDTKALKFDLNYGNERLNYSGSVIRTPKKITTNGKIKITGTIINSCNIEAGASLCHDAKALFFDYQLSSEELKVISRKLSSDFCSSLKFSLTDQIKFDELSISNEMDVLIGTVPLKITNCLKYAESKVLNSMIAARFDEKTMICLLPFFNTGMRGISYTGGITFIGNMGVSLNNVMNHKFSVFVQDFDFNPIDLTALNFDRFMHSFQYVSFKEGLAVRKMKVDSDYFRDCENSEPYILLRDIITFCEDPGFTSHVGVDSYFIGKAIVTNLKERKISRGGSTITMQLIKNLYLNEKKSFFRKFEEILLSLLFEKYSTVTKAQILDIYLQIVEFGPNIYGIKEGANYYFDKAIAELNIIDLIVLTYILPRPIFFNDALLIQSVQLRDNLSKYCRNISKFLVDNKVLNEEQYNSLENKIVFSKRLGEIEITLA